VQEAPTRTGAATSSIAASNAFKPMKFHHNGHAGPIGAASDIDIAGAGFSH
jgi:hypothetical protein